MADKFSKFQDLLKNGRLDPFKDGDVTTTLMLLDSPDELSNWPDLPQPVIVRETAVDASSGKTASVEGAAHVVDAQGQTHYIFHDPDNAGQFVAISAVELQQRWAPYYNQMNTRSQQGLDPVTGEPLSFTHPVTGEELTGGGVSSNLYEIDGELYTKVIVANGETRGREDDAFVRQGKLQLGDGDDNGSYYEMLIPVSALGGLNPGDAIGEIMKPLDQGQVYSFTADVNPSSAAFMAQVAKYAELFGSYRLDEQHVRNGVSLGNTDSVGVPGLIRTDDLQVAPSIAEAAPDVQQEFTESAPGGRAPARSREFSPVKPELEENTTEPEERFLNRKLPDALKRPVAVEPVAEEEPDFPNATEDPAGALDHIRELIEGGANKYGPEIGAVLQSGDQNFPNQAALFMRELQYNSELTGEAFLNPQAAEAAPVVAAPIVVEQKTAYPSVDPVEPEEGEIPFGEVEGLSPEAAAIVEGLDIGEWQRNILYGDPGKASEDLAKAMDRNTRPFEESSEYQVAQVGLIEELLEDVVKDFDRGEIDRDELVSSINSISGSFEIVNLKVGVNSVEMLSEGTQELSDILRGRLEAALEPVGQRLQDSAPMAPN